MNLSEGLEPGQVRTVAMVREAGVAAYNIALQGAPGLSTDGDVLTVPLWDVGDTPGTDGNTWRWHTWVQNLADADALKAVLESRGPANDPNNAKVAYWRSDEPDTGAGTETAPPGGWGTAETLTSSLRRPNGPLKVDDRA